MFFGELFEERVEELGATFGFVRFVVYLLVGDCLEFDNMFLVGFSFAEKVDAAEADRLEAVALDVEGCVELVASVPEGYEDFLHRVGGVVWVAEQSLGKRLHGALERDDSMFEVFGCQDYRLLLLGALFESNSSSLISGHHILVWCYREGALFESLLSSKLVNG